MSRGSYIGGSTIINSHGSGWSYDPLEQASPLRKMALDKKAVRKKAKETTKRNSAARNAKAELEKFVHACAACDLLGLKWPDPKEDAPFINSIKSKSSKGYHKSIINKVKQSREKARNLLDSYFVHCANAKISDKPTPNPSKLLSCLTRVDGFPVVLTSETLKTAERLKVKAWNNYVSMCAKAERVAVAWPPKPQRLLDMYDRKLDETLLAKAVKSRIAENPSTEIVGKSVEIVRKKRRVSTTLKPPNVPR